MSAPVALGGAALPPSPPGVTSLENSRMKWGANALSAPTTPDKRQPIVDRSKVDPQLLKAAQGFEEVFVNHMMNVMRQTVPKNDMDLESPATNIYRSMQDEEFSKKAVQAGGIGLADQIIAYWESQRYNLPRGQGAPQRDPTSLDARRTGGANEGQPVRK